MSITIRYALDQPAEILVDELAPVDVADLPFRSHAEGSRICRALSHAGIDTVGQLIATPFSKISSINGIGGACLHSLRGVLARLGLFLEGAPPPKVLGSAVPATSEGDIPPVLKRRAPVWARSFIEGLVKDHDSIAAQAERRLVRVQPDARFTCWHEDAPWTMNAWLIRIMEGGWARVRLDTYGIAGFFVDVYPTEEEARVGLVGDRAPLLPLQDLARVYETSVSQVEILIDDLRPFLDTDEDFSIWRSSINSLDVVIGDRCHRIRRPRHSMVTVFYMTDVVDEAGLRYMLLEAVSRPNCANSNVNSGRVQ